MGRIIQLLEIRLPTHLAESFNQGKTCFSYHFKDEVWEDCSAMTVFLDIWRKYSDWFWFFKIILFPTNNWPSTNHNDWKMNKKGLIGLQSWWYLCDWYPNGVYRISCQSFEQTSDKSISTNTVSKIFVDFLFTYLPNE